MLNFRRPTRQQADTELRMAAMIDIVFLLLVFFVMTFRIVPQEGDFNVDAGKTSSRGSEMDQQIPLQLRLSADSEGRLSELSLNGRVLSSRTELQPLLLSLADDGSLQSQSLLLACDYDLAYDEVIKTLDVVTGKRNAVGVVRPLIEKVEFASP
jgi:biopolymer transport protein ExbD